MKNRLYLVAIMLLVTVVVWHKSTATPKFAGFSPYLTSVQRVPVHCDAPSALNILLTRKADIGLREHGIPVLFSAEENVTIAQALIAEGANVNTTFGSERITPLHQAIRAGYEKTARLLVESGAEVNAADADGNTPLMLAAYYGSAELVKWLMVHKADVNAHNKSGETALMWAAQSGRIDIIAQLHVNGAAVNARSTCGYSALMLAVNDGNFEAVRLLIEEGANVNAVANDGRRVMDFVPNTNPPDVDLTHLLLRAGASK